MDIGLEVLMSDEASGEVVVSVDFKYRSGSPAHMGSLSYAGHPADPPEIELETIFWPYERWDLVKKTNIPDHIEMPVSGLPLAVSEAIEAYIIENYVEDYEDY